jgi:hypothetical protein
LPRSPRRAGPAHKKKAALTCGKHSPRDSPHNPRNSARSIRHESPKGKSNLRARPSQGRRHAGNRGPPPPVITTLFPAAGMLSGHPGSLSNMRFRLSCPRVECTRNHGISVSLLRTPRPAGGWFHYSGGSQERSSRRHRARTRASAFRLANRARRPAASPGGGETDLRHRGLRGVDLPKAEASSRTDGARLSNNGPGCPGQGRAVRACVLPASRQLRRPVTRSWPWPRDVPTERADREGFRVKPMRSAPRPASDGGIAGCSDRSCTTPPTSGT